MATVTVSPETFSMVSFEGDRIAALAERLAGEIGLPDDVEIRIEVDETSPLGRTTLDSVDPVVVSAESGAFENPKEPRHLSETNVTDVLGRVLFQAGDRLDPDFGAPSFDDDLPMHHSVAWDIYAVARLARLGYRSQRQRRLYHFRNRHGFTDVADAAFERVWTEDGLTWSDLVTISDEALAAREPAA